MDIEKIKKLNAEIANFETCYEGNELWGVIDGPVPPHKLLEFMIEHPYLQEIANNISKMDK